MDQRLSIVTLVVDDLPTSRAFYVDGLGWQAEFEGEDVAMFRVADKLLLSLWDRSAAEHEIGTVQAGSRDRSAPVTLAHNLRSTDDVDRVLAEARRAGSGQVSAGQWREWGGYSGYFTDPDGFRWEVAVNPTELGESLLS